MHWICCNRKWATSQPHPSRFDGLMVLICCCYSVDIRFFSIYRKKAASIQTASNESIVIKNCCEWALNYPFLYFIFLFALIQTVFSYFQFNFASFGWDSFYRKHLWCCLDANECLFALSGLILFHSTNVRNRLSFAVFYKQLFSISHSSHSLRVSV